MSSNSTWIGIAGSATAKGSVGYTLGSTVQHLHLWNCGNPKSLQAACVVTGSLNGLALHAGLGTSVAIITGVQHKAQLNGLVSSGWDFAIDVGGKIGDAIKTASRSPSILKAVLEYQKSADLATWLASESGKTAVNSMTGDFGLANGTPCFEIFSTPAGAGLGAGVWYENQTLSLCGSGLAWENVTINWRLVKHRDSIWLQMRNIPEKDGEELGVIGKQFHTLYPDGLVTLGQPKGSILGDARVVVRNGCIHEIDTAARLVGSPPEGGGINLSAREIGHVSNFPYVKNQFIDWDSVMRLGFRLQGEKKVLWQSGDATEVFFSLATERWNAHPGSRRLDKGELHYWTQ